MDNVPVWGRDDWEALPRLHDDLEADVCVVGLGGSGLSAVRELRALGRSVVGVDAGSVAGGAAGRNGGLLLAGLAAFHHDARARLGAERAVALYRATIEGVEAELATAGATARRVGSLRIAVDAAEEADCAEQYAIMRADGLPVERYTGPEGVGLLFPNDAVFDPLARCRRLARLALAAGAKLFEHSPVVELSGERVRTVHGSVACGSVVVAVDGRLAKLLPELAREVKDVRLQMLATAPTTEVSLPLPVYRRYGYEYFQQLPDGRVALGGFRDHGGEAEWTDAAEPSALVQGLLEAYLRDGLGVGAPITHRWAATVGYTDTLLPVAREAREGLWAIGGYSGTGNVVGAVLGRAVARRALGLPSAEWDLIAS